MSNQVSTKNNTQLLTISIGFLLFLWFCQLTIARTIDRQLIDWIHSFHWPLLDNALVPFTVIGSIEVSVTGLLVLSIVFYRRGDYQHAYLLITGLLVLTALEFILKHIYVHHIIPASYLGRYPAQVPLVGHIDVETPYSFPSGHAMRSAFVLGGLYMGISTLNKRGFLYLILVYLTGQAIAVNNYGFHWLSDCLAGYWLAGLALCIIQQLRSV